MDTQSPTPEGIAATQDVREAAAPEGAERALDFCAPHGQFVMAYQECPDSPLCGIRYIPAARVKELFVKALEARNLMREGVDEDNDAALAFGFGWLDAVLTSVAQDLLPSDCRAQLVAGTDAVVMGGGGEKPRK